MNDIRTSPIFDAIFSFNEQVVGIPVNQPLGPLTEKQWDWTMKAYAEEVAEYGLAVVNDDLIGMVDATMDLIYFAVGTLKKLGLTREQAYAVMMVINTANMTKKKGIVVGRGSDEDAAKPEDFVPPEKQIGYILFGDPENEGI